MGRRPHRRRARRRAVTRGRLTCRPIPPRLISQKSTGKFKADYVHHATVRAVLDAILFVMLSGCRWADLPPTYRVHPSTAWRRLGRWEADGTWERIWRAFLASLDAESKLRWAEAFLDGTFVPAGRADAPPRGAPA